MIGYTLAWSPLTSTALRNANDDWRCLLARCRRSSRSESPKTGLRWKASECSRYGQCTARPRRADDRNATYDGGQLQLADLYTAIYHGRPPDGRRNRGTV